MVSVIPPYYVRYVHTFTHWPMRKLWITCPVPVTCDGAPVRRPRDALAMSSTLTWRNPLSKRADSGHGTGTKVPEKTPD